MGARAAMTSNHIRYLCMALASLNVQAASFDCAKATSLVEQEICHNPRLSTLDEQMANAYKRMLAANVSAKAQEALKASQKKWLASRNKCANEKCLVAAYQARINEFMANSTDQVDPAFLSSQIGNFIYFAAENPPTDNIPPEAPLCYKFEVPSIEEQLAKLKKKYPGLYDYRIDKISTGKNLLAKRRDDNGAIIDYFYSTNPAICNEYQGSRFATTEEDSDEPAATSWGNTDNIAFTSFSRNGATDIDLGIAYIPENDCANPVLFIKEQPTLKTVTLFANNQKWGPAAFESVNQGVMALLDGQALDMFKNSYSGYLLLDQIKLEVDFRGSALAINQALAHCKTLLSSAGTPDIAQATVDQHQPSGALKSKKGNFSVNGNVLFYANEIEEGDFDQFRSITREMQRSGNELTTLVFVNNLGGSLSEAMKIGEFLRENKISTAAAKECASACIYAFAGGVQRTSYLNTKFGLHQIRLADGDPGTLAAGQRISSILYSYLEEMGVNPKIAIWQSEVDADQIRWISQYEANGLKLVTKVVENHDLETPDLSVLK